MPNYILRSKIYNNGFRRVEKAGIEEAIEVAKDDLYINAGQDEENVSDSVSVCEEEFLGTVSKDSSGRLSFKAFEGE